MKDMKIIKDLKLDLDEEEILRYQGYSRNKVREPNQNILRITEEEINRGYSLFKPQGIYSLIKIKGSALEGRINLESGLIFRFAKSIIKQLKGASHLLVGVVTIGDLLEKKVSDLFSQGEYPRALTLDVIGTVAVEDFSRKVRKLACQEVIEQGFKTSRHFSPGYSGWEVSQQEIVFKSIPSDNIGVSLTKGFMMLPQKSLSWVIGAGKEIIVSSEEENKCKDCQSKYCNYKL
jgi:bifunctional DNase/RNase